MTKKTDETSDQLSLGTTARPTTPVNSGHTQRGLGPPARPPSPGSRSLSHRDDELLHTEVSPASATFMKHAEGKRSVDVFVVACLSPRDTK